MATLMSMTWSDYDVEISIASRTAACMKSPLGQSDRILAQAATDAGAVGIGTVQLHHQFQAAAHGIRPVVHYASRSDQRLAARDVVEGSARICGGVERSIR